MDRITTKGYPGNARAAFILAHGAGAPMDSPFMDVLARELEYQGIACVRFEFPYMKKRREDGKKRFPDKQPVLLGAFQAEIQRVRGEIGARCPLIIGGKSMGGRMASVLASDGVDSVDGVVCFGYPFHPPGKLDRWRTNHLSAIRCPLLIVQGTRDPFGRPDELKAQGHQEGITRLCWLDGGDHDFVPPVRHPLDQGSLIRQAAVLSRQFIEEIAG